VICQDKGNLRVVWERSKERALMFQERLTVQVLGKELSG